MLRADSFRSTTQEVSQPTIIKQVQPTLSRKLSSARFHFADGETSLDKSGFSLRSTKEQFSYSARRKIREELDPHQVSYVLGIRYGAKAFSFCLFAGKTGGGGGGKAGMVTCPCPKRDWGSAFLQEV